MRDASKPSPDDPVDFLLDDEPAVIPLEKPRDAPRAVVCKMCFAKRIEKDGPCPACGFDERAGLKPSTLVGRKPLGKSAMQCVKCGYDLTGLRSLRCPECGNVAKPPSVRDYDRAESRRIAIATYRTSLLMLGIGGGVLFLALILIFGPGLAGLYMLKYVIEVPIGVAVFLFCCMLWIGFDAPIHLTALRLAAIYAVVDLTRITLGVVLPMPLIPWVISLVVYISLLASMLELEWQDAAMVGALTYIAKLIVGFAILTMMMSG